MKKSLIIHLSLLLSLGLLINLNAQCVGNEDNVVGFELDGINYEIVKEKLNWSDAASCAVERGGFLLEVNSIEEQNGVFSELNGAGINLAQTIAPDGGGASYVWTGGTDRVTEGTWLWDGNNDEEGLHFWQGDASGMAIDHQFVFWGNEPDNFSNQDGLGIALTDWPFGNAGQWNDVREINRLYFVIEYPDESSNTHANPLRLNFKLFPNPASEYIVISMEGQEPSAYQMELVNSFGQILYNATFNGFYDRIPLNNIPEGSYFVRLINGKDRIVRRIFVR